MPVLPFSASLGILACALAAGCGASGGERQGPPADAAMNGRARSDGGRSDRRRATCATRACSARDARGAAPPLRPRGATAPQAYDDHPLPIGDGQTISQPYIVALMTELARPSPDDRALEIGTGSGYQAAVLSRLVAHVYSVELNEALHEQAAARLKTLGYTNVTAIRATATRDGPTAAPYDIVLVTAAPEEVPEALVAQLKPGGRLVIPVGGYVAGTAGDREGRGRADADAKRRARDVRAAGEGGQRSTAAAVGYLVSSCRRS